MICYICNRQEASLQCPICTRYVCSTHAKKNPCYKQRYVILTPTGGKLGDYPYICYNCPNEAFCCDLCQVHTNIAVAYCAECGSKFCKDHGDIRWKDGVPDYRCDRHKCFIATACIKVKGLPDDCFELNVLRAFRDKYVKSLPQGEQLISEYYLIAPRILERINQTVSPRDVYLGIYEQLVLESLRLIQAREEGKAFENIVNIVNGLKQEYL